MPVNSQLAPHIQHCRPHNLEWQLLNVHPYAVSFLAGTPDQLSRIVPDYPSGMFRLKLSTDVEANLYHFDIFPK